MDYRKYLELKDHPNMNTHKELKPGMTLSYNRKFDKFFINNLVDEPQDSWGATWALTQGCVMLYPEELDNLIIELQKIKSYRDTV